jgi:hypothetical protein
MRDGSMGAYLAVPDGPPKGAIIAIMLQQYFATRRIEDSGPIDNRAKAVLEPLDKDWENKKLREELDRQSKEYQKT